MGSVVMLLAVWLAAQNPADLAAAVASGDPARREEAAGAIEEIGRPSLAALRAAIEKADDPSASRRLADLVDLIERRRVLRATPVELDLKDVPVTRAVDDLGRSIGVGLLLDPSSRDAWASRRVTYATRGPIGFWEAIDGLGEAAGFRAEPSAWWFLGPPPSGPVVRLVRREEGPAPRASYAGPYRVELIGLTRHRTATQARPGAPPKTSDEFHAELRLTPEPGIELDRNGSPRIDEAVDEKGADLRPASTADPLAQRPFVFRQWRTESLGTLSFRIPLGIPAARGGTLKHFRGTLPITAMARTAPIMDLRLDGPEGRAVSSGGITLRVDKLDRIGGRVQTIHLNVRGEAIQAGPSIAPGPRQLTNGPLRPMYHADDHVQILDDQGRPHGLFSGLSTPRPDGSFDARIQLHAAMANGPATTLRYFGVVGEAIEVPFGFDDVPLP